LEPEAWCKAACGGKTFEGDIADNNQDDDWDIKDADEEAFGNGILA